MLNYSSRLTGFRPRIIVCLGGAEDAAVCKHSDDFFPEGVIYENLVSLGGNVPALASGRGGSVGVGSCRLRKGGVGFWNIDGEGMRARGRNRGGGM